MILILPFWYSWCVHAGQQRFYFIFSVYETQICSRLPYHNHLARCFDLNRWNVTDGAGRVWYICSQTTLFYPVYFAGHSALEKVGCFLPPPLSVCAGRKYAPVHSVPWCSLAGPVNHLPVTGGGNTTVGLEVQRWHLAHALVRCLAHFRRKWHVPFFFMRESKKKVSVLCRKSTMMQQMQIYILYFYE